MQPPAARLLVLPADWPEVLDGIQAALAEDVAQAAAREQALAATPAPAAAETAAAQGQAGLARADARLTRFRSALEAAERGTARLDAWLAEGQEAARDGLAAIDRLRQRLADRPRPGV